MRPFKFLEPRNLEHACSLLARHGDRARVIAGGQSLLPVLKHRVISPRYLINLKGLPGLEYVRIVDGGLAIGALATHRALETSALVKTRFPVLAEMESTLGSVPVRNWGTIGGNLCHADPGGDAGPVLMVLGARLKAVSARGQRHIAVREFFKGYLETTLEPDEILAEVEVPQPLPHSGAVYWKESVRTGDYAIASVAALVEVDGAVIRNARIVLGAVGSTPVEATLTEKALTGKPIDVNLDEAASLAAAEANPKIDVEGSAEYKRQIVKYITKEALRRAIARAQDSNSGTGL
ncbi:MAG: xanthine dehydrogenase family protein subunit M [Chloroflexi bacterium]|nr:xanthine dehydrogenase family protein subunit M [Chloroflexota bacterium]